MSESSRPPSRLHHVAGQLLQAHHEARAIARAEAIDGRVSAAERAEALAGRIRAVLLAVEEEMSRC